MNKLRALFASDRSYNSFKERYFLAYNPRRLFLHTPDALDWNVVADEIYARLESTVWEPGDLVAVELPSYESRTGNPELILVGELVVVPMPQEDGEIVGFYLFE